MAVYFKRKTKKGTCYQAIIRVKGYKTLCKTFKLKSEAMSWAEPIELDMKRGVYREGGAFVPPLINDIKTCGDLIMYFKENIAPVRYKNPHGFDYEYDWWVNQIGMIYLRDLTPAVISVKKELLKSEQIQKSKDIITTRSAATINYYIMALSAVLSYAVEELGLLEVNPCSKVRLMPLKNRRTRFLSQDEIKKLLEVTREYSECVYLFFLISLSTGARYSEVLHLRVSDVDFINNQVFYLDTKNKESRGVPLNSQVAELLRGFMDKNGITSGNIFGKEDGYWYIRGALEKCIKRAGIENFRIHDIRHTTASYIAMNGGSLLDIAEILGHKSLTMARRYSHLTQKHTAEVLNKVTGRILPF